MTSDELPECPLCMVELFYDDLAFYPCSCGYQICRFCWSKILNEENGLCPACRRPYDSEAPASFTPLSEEQFQKLKKEKRQKDRKNKTIENRKHLADIRVVQKNLAFVIGLPQRFAENSETLKSPEYFGKYGKVFKVVVNRNASQPGSQNQSTVGAYVTFVRGEDTIQAILDLNKQQMEGRTLKASLGTTKYCSQFLKGVPCTKSECMYLHELGEEAASFTKEEMQQNKHTEYERKLIDDYVVQAGLSSESQLSSSASSLTSQQSQSQSQNSQQNQLQPNIRQQHASECRDHSSSSSNSNTPPSSRRQTKSESQSQAHRQSQQSHSGKHQHQANHKLSTGSANTISSGDNHINPSVQQSQKTPRKNSQNFKSQTHHQPQSQTTHSRNAHNQQQKQQQKQVRPTQQQHNYQQQQSQSTQPQSQFLQPVDNQNQKSLQQCSPVTTCTVAASLPSEVSTCPPAGGDSGAMAAPSVSNEASFSNRNTMSLSSALLRSLDQQASQHSSDLRPMTTDDTSTVTGTDLSDTTTVSGTTNTQLKSPSPSMLPSSHPLRPPAQVLNGVTGSPIGMSPYQFPQMYSFQYMIEQQRQHLQQQQQKQHETHQQTFQQSMLDSFDSQAITTTSYSSEQPKQTDVSTGNNTESLYQLPPGQSSHWGITSETSLSTSTMKDGPSSNSMNKNTPSLPDDAANLDFDPVKESQQGLAVLLEDERNHGSNNSQPGAMSGFLNNSCNQTQLTPPPGFEMQQFHSSMRPSVLRPSNLNMGHPGMMGYSYYSSCVPPGTMEMNMHNDRNNEPCINRAEASNMNVGANLRGDDVVCLNAPNSPQTNIRTPNSPGLPFSVKALQDTLRCVLAEETNITFDPSLMRDIHLQLQQNASTTAVTHNTNHPLQINRDPVMSNANLRAPLVQPNDAMTNPSPKEPQASLWPPNGLCVDDDPAVVASAPDVSNSHLQQGYCSLWPQHQSPTRTKATSADSELCLRNDTVWSSPTTPPGFGPSMLSLLGGLSSNSIHGVGVDGQRSAISVDAQTSVTATGDQQQAVNKL